MTTLACTTDAARCRRAHDPGRHDLPTTCRHGHYDEYGCPIYAGACAFYRVCEHYRERFPVDGGWIRPMMPPTGYATPLPCGARGGAFT